MRSVQDGEEALAKEGCQWSLSLSEDGGHTGSCGMATIAVYIRSHRQTIAVYVVMRPVFKACMEGKRRQGSMPRQWWWEQPMCLAQSMQLDPMQTMATWMHPLPQMHKGGNLPGHGGLLQSQWKMSSLSPTDWTHCVQEGKGVAAVQPRWLCHHGPSAATWVDSNGGNVSLLDVFNL
jgi:hypothetical protein